MGWHLTRRDAKNKYIRFFLDDCVVHLGALLYMLRLFAVTRDDRLQTRNATELAGPSFFAVGKLLGLTKEK